MNNCVIIDDEQPARELLAKHLSHLPEFELIASLDNALDGKALLQQRKPDLLFLDIRMPKISGLELIASLTVRPKIILTTAYREYAVEAFEWDVLDYLVKPITQERFAKAIAKFQQAESTVTESNIYRSRDNAYVFLKVGTGEVKTYLNDIIYIEGLKDYVRVCTTTKTFVASERLMYMEEKLPQNRFARIHKSYIVSLDKISALHTGALTAAGVKLPIGRAFKNTLAKKMQQP